MGTYNNIVDFEIPCPVCGMTVSDFKSKDGLHGRNLFYWEVDNFYSSCDSCNTFIEFDRKEKKNPALEHYSMRVEVLKNE